jgi:16S rRNA (guanine527-N7)-methyltransferase
MSDTLLERGLSILGIPFGGREMDLLRKYREEVTLWNRRLSLVGAEGDAFVVRHLLDILAGFALFEGSGGERIADVGSGGGLPGIPLAVFLPERRFFLVERSMKKGTFLSSCVMVLGLRNVEVLPVSLEMLRSRFDIVTFRAFRSLQDFFKPLLGITEPGGLILAYKGKRSVAEEEIESVRRYQVPSRLVPLSVPFLDEERHMAVFMKPTLE